MRVTHCYVPSFFSLQAFTGSIIEHPHNIQPNPQGQSGSSSKVLLIYVLLTTMLLVYSLASNSNCGFDYCSLSFLSPQSRYPDLRCRENSYHSS